MSFQYNKNLTSLVRPALAPSNREEFVGLDKNEAPFTLQDLDPSILTQLDQVSLRTYPDPYSLYSKLATFLNVGIDQLLLTFGSEQAIRFCFELVRNENASVVMLEPSFAMFNVFADQFGYKKSILHYTPDLTIEVQDIVNSITIDTRLVVVANPNNPTGTILDNSDIERIATRASEMNALFLLDEVYAHYSQTSALGLINKFSNLVVTQSFSKSWGLAGARVGYLVANRDTINLFRKLKAIDELTAHSIQVAKLALSHPELLDLNLQQVNKWKFRFSKIDFYHLKYIPTHANFILFRATKSIRDKLEQWFQDNKIIARTNFTDKTMCEYLRFSISNDVVMNKIHATMLELASGNLDI